jgi:hypothetical protein
MSAPICRQCGLTMVKRNAGFLGWVWGCSIHDEEWRWAGTTADPNAMQTRRTIDAHRPLGWNEDDGDVMHGGDAS